MAARSRLRKLWKWFCFVGSCVCLCGLIGSRWVGVWLGTGSRAYAGVRYGALEVGLHPLASRSVAVGFSLEHYRDPYAWRTGFGGEWHDATHFSALIPLWPPFVCFGALAAVLWVRDKRAARAELVGHCSSCGYDRRGLESATACPECGSKH
jgi:hypothetical protein